MMNAGFLTNNIDVQKSFVPSSHWKTFVSDSTELAEVLSRTMWYKTFLGNNQKSKPVNLT